MQPSGSKTLEVDSAAAAALTVDNHGDVHEVDLAPRLHAGLAAVHALVRLGHLVDLQVVVGQNLVPAFPERRRQETERECQAE